MQNWIQHVKYFDFFFKILININIFIHLDDLKNNLFCEASTIFYPVVSIIKFKDKFLQFLSLLILLC